MHDLLHIAFVAFLGAAAAGLIGAVALWLLRRRSVAVAMNVVVVVPVAAMLGGTLVVTRAMLLSDYDLSVVTTVLLSAAVVSLVPAMLLGRWVVARSRDLARAAQTVGDEGGFSPPGGASTAELTSLAGELSSVSAKLAASRQRERALEAARRDMVAWISHDLRTPLAGLRAMSEALEDGVAAEPERYFRQIGAEVHRLDSMVGDLFTLSRIQAGALALDRTRMSVEDLADEALTSAQALAKEHGVRLVGDPVEAVPVEVDGREMSRVLANLLVNAIQRTPAEGTVTLSARRGDGGVVISVTDGCGGIPPQDLPHVFDMGWRGTPARTRTPSSSAGLGLAIVHGIVTAHAGSADVRNVVGGCCFAITLPAGAPPAGPPPAPAPLAPAPPAADRPGAPSPEPGT
ncbi:cell wall metabolism sensor histidine kinase WalK [Streptomyces sp. TS71-3]|uniref:sensor histidine kinase n=1 Tax=Streptomyces sp. TS71-3 TaxID=2733862 RepID=UPI001B2006D6|nr:HAMP domain-containing sensor histidine kinase [Streptomyces sp. TS71-3]GHJ37998.1 two-component sensor histidine kinase [Streptomyces sp. TS71-3]